MPQVRVEAYGRTLSLQRGLLIGGEWVRGNGEAITTINPATEHAITEVDGASREDVDKAVLAARECLDARWGLRVKGAERGRLIHKLAELLERDADDLAAIESLDTGKALHLAKADVYEAIACLRYFAGAADKIQGATIEVDDETTSAMTRREPIGVVAQIVPWNYPLAMWSWKVAPALAAGCTILFKPAENTPLSTLKVSELFEEAGFPSGVFNCLNGLGSVTGAALAEHMDIQKIAFTGSTATGRRIATAAAQSNLKKVTLELGGKSAHIVFNSADLEEAAKWAAYGVFENMGQCCTSGSRILVQDAIYDAFLEKLVKAAKQVNVGNLDSPEAFQGPQISDVQYKKILGYVARAREQGVEVILGGKKWGAEGYYIEPTIFSNVPPRSEIATEEIFGPVASVIRFRDEDEAVRIANDTSYGLAAGLHSTDTYQIHRVTRRLRAGTVWVNHYMIQYPSVPFGGYKMSGWGRELGMEGLDAYLMTKAVLSYHGPKLSWPIRG